MGRILSQQIWGGGMKILTISKVVTISAFMSLCAVIPNAFAGGGGGGMIVFDPTNYSQSLLTAANTLNTAKNMATSVGYEYTSMQTELQNFANFNKQYKWADVSQTLQNLASAVSVGQSIAYSASNVNSAFQQAYPGYKPTQNFNQSYQNWSTTTLDTIRGVLDSTSMEFGDFGNEESTVATLRSLASNPQGQMQAIQAGSMIAGDMANQMIELRQIMMAQTNSQAAYQAYQVQNDQANQANWNNLMGNINTNYPSYNNGGGFGNIPPISH